MWNNPNLLILPYLLIIPKSVAQALMQTLRKELKNQGVDTLIGLIASNEYAQRFYQNLPNSEIKDEGI